MWHCKERVGKGGWAGEGEKMTMTTAQSSSSRDIRISFILVSSTSNIVPNKLNSYLMNYIWFEGS